MELDDHLRLRFSSDYKARLKRVAKIHKRNPTELARIHLESFIDAEEIRLKLPRIEADTWWQSGARGKPPDYAASSLNDRT